MKTSNPLAMYSDASVQSSVATTDRRSALTVKSRGSAVDGGSSDTPVLLVVFNRPDTTRRVFDAIRKARPKQLFVAADGPREGVQADRALCDAARAAASRVDWDCEVHTLFRVENLGCGLGPSSGPSSAISWFFENVEAGIILEDDCVPEPSFFRFCEELLERYRDVPRVMMISGDNFLSGRKRGAASYYFSRYTHIWGWATWRRAWHHFDYEAIPEELRNHGIWDWQWRFAVEKNRGLAVAPNVNLVTNVGCGIVDAAHTSDMDERYANLPTRPMVFPLTHPRRIRRMDRYTDFTPSRPEERTYLGAPLRFARLGYRKGRNRAASFVKRTFLERP